jgi:hypothetical protein
MARVVHAHNASASSSVTQATDMECSAHQDRRSIVLP